jgi:hypothetical protein
MNAHLVVHILIELLAAKQHPHAASEFSEWFHEVYSVSPHS